MARSQWPREVSAAKEWAQGFLAGPIGTSRAVELEDFAERCFWHSVGTSAQHRLFLSAGMEFFQPLTVAKHGGAAAAWGLAPSSSGYPWSTHTNTLDSLDMVSIYVEFEDDLNFGSTEVHVVGSAMSLTRYTETTPAWLMNRGSPSPKGCRKSGIRCWKLQPIKHCRSEKERKWWPLVISPFLMENAWKCPIYRWFMMIYLFKMVSIHRF